MDNSQAERIEHAIANPGDPATAQPGRWASTLRDMLMKQASIVAAEQLAGPFHLVTLASADFNGAHWRPGQKVQIAMGNALAARTFTPLDWNPASGQIRLLGYAHGNGPASAWLRAARPGVRCHVFGPRPSLDLRQACGPLVVFGDETSIGLAHALLRDRPPGTVRCLLEVGDLASARAVAAQLALDNTDFIARQPDDAHLDTVATRLWALAVPGVTMILTGNAQAIQRLRRTMKSAGLPASCLLTKAYWAHGKTGLD